MEWPTHKNSPKVRQHFSWVANNKLERFAKKIDHPLGNGVSQRTTLLIVWPELPSCEITQLTSNVNLQ